MTGIEISVCLSWDGGNRIRTESSPFALRGSRKSLEGFGGPLLTRVCTYLSRACFTHTRSTLELVEGRPPRGGGVVWRQRHHRPGQAAAISYRDVRALGSIIPPQVLFPAL